MFFTVFTDISLIFIQICPENFGKIIRDPPFITFARVLSHKAEGTYQAKGTAFSLIYRQFVLSGVCIIERLLYGVNYLPGHLLATISSSPCANRLQLITPSMQSPYPWIFKSTPSVPVQIGPLASSLQSLPHAMINDFKSINNDRKFSDIDHLKCFWEICSSYEIFFDKTKCCLSIQHLILV